MIKRNSKSGMTLVEVLIATGIFALASMIALLTTIQINNLQYHNRVQQRLQEESRYAFEFINREVATADTVSASGNTLTITKAGVSTSISQVNTALIVDPNNHTLTGGDVQVMEFTLENVGTDQKAVNVTLTLKIDTTTRNLSIYKSPQKLDNITYKLQTTFAIPD